MRSEYTLEFFLLIVLLSNSNIIKSIILLQVILDKEQKEMAAARVPEAKNTDSFDFANYHTLEEVSTQNSSGYCYPVNRL